MDNPPQGVHTWPLFSFPWLNVVNLRNFFPNALKGRFFVQCTDNMLTWADDVLLIAGCAFTMTFVSLFALQEGKARSEKEFELRQLADELDIAKAKAAQLTKVCHSHYVDVEQHEKGVGCSRETVCVHVCECVLVFSIPCL